MTYATIPDYSWSAVRQFKWVMEQALPELFTGVEPEATRHPDRYHESRNCLEYTLGDGKSRLDVRGWYGRFRRRPKLHTIDILVEDRHFRKRFSESIRLHDDRGAPWGYRGQGPRKVTIDLDALRAALTRAAIAHRQTLEDGGDETAEAKALAGRVAAARQVLDTSLADFHLEAASELDMRDADSDATLASLPVRFTGRYDLHLRALTADEVLVVAQALERARRR